MLWKGKGGDNRGRKGYGGERREGGIGILGFLRLREPGEIEKKSGNIADGNGKKNAGMTITKEGGNREFQIPCLLPLPPHNVTQYLLKVACRAAGQFFAIFLAGARSATCVRKNKPPVLQNTLKAADQEASSDEGF